MNLNDKAEAELQDLRERGLERCLRPVDGAQSSWLVIDGRRVLSMSSNNYLGLADHPQLAEAASAAARDLGCGSGASRLISGSMTLHHNLEDKLAALKGTERALLFNSGYQANIGVVTALTGPGDVIFSDELNHASIIDGCRLSRARVQVYPHCDMHALEHRLNTTPATKRLIVSDSIFSMDGDTAPIGEICALANHYDAMVLIDEAHATGAVGEHGCGVVTSLGLQDEVTAQVGTLGKALEPSEPSSRHVEPSSTC